VLLPSRYPYIDDGRSGSIADLSCEWTTVSITFPRTLAMAIGL